MTTSFYAPASAFRDASYVALPGEEAEHAVRVLRKRPGDEIVVVDGDGGWYRVRLDRVDRRCAAGRVLETRRDVGEASYELSLGVGLLKNRNRFETLLEKAVELGVSEVIPLITERTEKTYVKRQRAEKVLVAAMKQCGRSRLMRLSEPLALAHVLGNEDAAVALIGHERTPPSYRLERALKEEAAGRRICVLIGPEGGFTEEEVSDAQLAGFTPVSLGPRRLRSETAALVAASVVMMSYCSETVR